MRKVLFYVPSKYCHLEQTTHNSINGNSKIIKFLCLEAATVTLTNDDKLSSSVKTCQWARY